MAEKVRELIQEYQAGKITRREFIGRAVFLTGSLAAAAKVIESVLPSFAHSAQVDPQDPDLDSGNIEFTGKAGTVFAYLSRPKATGSYPVVVVIHENRGINDHIRDVARRFAKEGYVVLAPDYLSRQGGTHRVNPEGKGLRNIRELVPLEHVSEDTEAGMTFLRSRPEVSDERFGIVGFCWGGEMAFGVATRVRGLKAVVVYYGRSPNPVELVQKIEAPVLAHYGSEDKRVNEGIPETEEAMQRFQRAFSYKIFSGAQHAFNNDTNPGRYHAEAAKEAWGLTLEFFNKHLKN